MCQTASPPGNAEALVRLVTACYEEKCRPRRLVEGRTWQRWADDHHRLFQRLLNRRGEKESRPRPLR